MCVYVCVNMRCAFFVLVSLSCCTHYIYLPLTESDRVSFADYKKNLQRQLEFIPLPVEMAKRGVSTRKENEVFALGAVALVSDLNSVTGTPPLPAAPPGHTGSTIITRTRDTSPAHVPAPLSLQAPLSVAQVQAAAAAARAAGAPAAARPKQLLNSSGSSGLAAPVPTAPTNTNTMPSFQDGEQPDEEVLEAR